MKKVTIVTDIPVSPQKGTPGFLKPVHEIAVVEVHCSSRTWERSDANRPMKFTPIEMRELQIFFGILLYSADNCVPQLNDYWAESGEGSLHPVVQRAMSRDRFQLIYSCFCFSDEQIVDLEGKINKQMKKIWDPANVTIVDESMTPHKGRQNPHHVFIARKPLPHGIKNWSLVDFSGYFLSFSQFRRNCAPEASHETLIRMTAPLPPGSLVCADSYFGSVKALEKLVKSGKDCLFSCNKSRPLLLFKDGTSQGLSNGQSKSAWGEVEGEDGRPVAFMANSFQSEGRTLCTLSTVYSDVLQERELEVLMDDETEEDQSRYTLLNEFQPEVRNKYSEIMDCVDRVDQHILAALSPHRKFDWSTAEKLWEITMLLIVNARKVYMSVTGTNPLVPPKWRRILRDFLLKGLEPCKTREHPPTLHQKNAFQPARCRSCAWKKKDMHMVW